MAEDTRWTFGSSMLRWTQTGVIQLNLIGIFEHGKAFELSKCIKELV